MTDAQLAELYKTGHKYRRELLAMPLAQLAPIIQHMTMRLGVRGKESVGTLDTDAELRPYTGQKNASDNTQITLRTLETYHGSVVKEFEPKVLSATIYGNTVATKPTDTDIVKAVAMLMAQKATNKIGKALFAGVRNGSGTTTNDLFDGFSTIIAAEKTAGEIAAGKGNCADLGALSVANIVDKLMEFYQDAACEELQDQQVKMFLPRGLYNMYNRGYQIDFGATPYNKEYKKTFLEGTDDRCELVPLSGLTGTGKIILTTKNNMLIGADQMSDMESVRIRECDNPFVAQFVMELFFGVQFESINKERLCIGEHTIATGEESGGSGDTPTTPETPETGETV